MIISRLVHLDVEDQVEELLRQLSYAIKNQLVAYNRSFLYMEATYPYAIKNQRGASKISPRSKAPSRDQ